MTDAPDRMAQVLDQLAEMDLSAARHVHQQLMAATEPKAVAELSRAYQRCSRAVRQVVMLRMKHDRDRAEAAPPPPRPAPPVYPPSAMDSFIDNRSLELERAVGRVAAAAHPGKLRLQREALDRLDVQVEAWLSEDDDELLLGPLDDCVVEVCEQLGLPLALARAWETLPDPPVPLRDTG